MKQAKKKKETKSKFSGVEIGKNLFTHTQHNLPISSLLRDFRSGNIQIPPFQRGRVWTNRNKLEYLAEIIVGRPLEPIVLSKSNDTSDRVLLDGLQRLSTIDEFKFGKLKITPSVSKKYYPDDTNGGLNINGLTYSKLPVAQQHNFDDFNIPVRIIEFHDSKNQADYFLTLQEGVNLTAAEKLPAELQSCKVFEYLNKYLIESPGYLEKVCSSKRGKRQIHRTIGLKQAMLYWKSDNSQLDTYSVSDATLKKFYVPKLGDVLDEKQVQTLSIKILSDIDTLHSIMGTDAVYRSWDEHKSEWGQRRADFAVTMTFAIKDYDKKKLFANAEKVKNALKQASIDFITNEKVNKKSCTNNADMTEMYIDTFKSEIDKAIA